MPINNLKVSCKHPVKCVCLFQCCMLNRQGSETQLSYYYSWTNVFFEYLNKLSYKRPILALHPTVYTRFTSILNFSVDPLHTTVSLWPFLSATSSSFGSRAVSAGIYSSLRLWSIVFVCDSCMHTTQPPCCQSLMRCVLLQLLIHDWTIPVQSFFECSVFVNNTNDQNYWSKTHVAWNCYFTWGKD